MAKIFLLGATGHIGGATLDALLRQWPDIEITALIRDEQKAQRLVARFGSVKTVIGDSSNVDIIERESKDAGIVINFAPDAGHEATVAAITRGLAARPQKGFYIHTSGAALIWSDPSGVVASEKVWDDVADIGQIISMPPERTHAASDQVVRDAGSIMNVAIVSPTAVYGLSASTEHPTPLTIPDVIATMKNTNGGFKVANGANRWGFVHANDLAHIYVALAADALKWAGATPELWGQQAYYFGVSEELSFAEYMDALVPLVKAKGLIESDEVKRLGSQDALNEKGVRPDTDSSVWSKQIVIMFGSDMRCESVRAKKLLGWQPKEKSVKETLPEVLDVFFKRGKH